MKIVRAVIVLAAFILVGGIAMGFLNRTVGSTPHVTQVFAWSVVGAILWPLSGHLMDALFPSLADRSADRRDP